MHASESSPFHSVAHSFYHRCNFSWNCYALLERHGHQAVVGLLIVVKGILFHPVLLEGLQRAINLPRQDFKNESNHGYVWMDKRNVDLGNIAYSILYCMVYRYAGHYHYIDYKCGEVWRAFQDLEQRYSSLQLGESSKNAIIMKADVIETVLWIARQSGEVIMDNY